MEKREGLCSQSLTCLVLLPWTRFRQRLYALSRFIIYDTQRGFIVIWDGISLKMQPVLNANEPKLHEDEKHYQRLWKTFFNSVAIESRKNPKQQRNYVPLLYRELMTEFQ